MEEKLEQLRSILMPKTNQMELHHTAITDLTAKFEAHQYVSMPLYR
jgi:hypothetical protein